VLLGGGLERARDRAIYLVHGALDWMFPVATARVGRAALEEAGARLVYREVAESTPMKRWGTPDDVAGAAVYLASPAAAFLTGQTIMVGGGLVM